MRTLIWNVIFLLAIAFGLMNAGCSSWFHKEAEAKPIIIDDAPAVRFSENNNLLNVNNRNYRKMTRQRLEEESELNAQAGSMWVMEGQGAYLFAQNKARREGDLLKVHLEGPAHKQVETKVSVIKMLLKQLEEEELKQKQEADPKANEQKLAEKKDDKRAPASEAPKEKKDEKEEGIVDNVPTRIVERQADGNYRVKGQEPFMIGKREYKVLVTGIIRPEDFNDEGVSSNKLIDPQYDVVSIRRKATALLGETK